MNQKFIFELISKSTIISSNILTRTWVHQHTHAHIIQDNLPFSFRQKALIPGCNITIGKSGIPHDYTLSTEIRNTSRIHVININKEYPSDRPYQKKSGIPHG